MCVCMCVSTIHQNVKLTIHGSKLKHLTEEHTLCWNGHNECMSRITCTPAGPACFLGECKKCASLDAFKNELMPDNIVHEVQYIQWTSTDRSTLETVLKPVKEFVTDFCVKKHDYVTKQQTLYLPQRKESLWVENLLLRQFL